MIAVKNVKNGVRDQAMPFTNSWLDDTKTHMKRLLPYYQSTQNSIKPLRKMSEN